MLVIPGTTIHLAARAIESRGTRYPEAWFGEVVTVQLDGILDVTRLAERPGGLLGEWFALGDGPTDPASFARATRFHHAGMPISRDCTIAASGGYCLALYSTSDAALRYFACPALAIKLSLSTVRCRWRCGLDDRDLGGVTRDPGGI